MERTLCFTIEITSPQTFEVFINDLQSGDCITIPCTFHGSSVKSEDAKIISEIRSWASIMLEELEEDEEFDS